MNSFVVEIYYENYFEILSFNIQLIITANEIAENIDYINDINWVHLYKNVDYKRSEIMKIKDRKVQLESLVRSLDDWNKKFDSTELEKTSKIEEIDMKIEELERNKSAISSNFESKTELYVLNNTRLQII